MASKQIGDVNRRKRRHLNAIRQELKYDKRFIWLMRKPISEGYSIEIPKGTFSLYDMGALNMPDGFELKPLDPSVKGTYTTPAGEVKDLRDLPSCLELLIGNTGS